MSPRLCKECVLRLKPYIPGKPIEEVQREYGLTDIVKLASNENPLGASPKAIEAMKKACDNVALYPDGSCFTLRNALASHLGVQPDYLSFGAGSDELIREIGNVFLEEGDCVIQSDPTFSQYEGAATSNNCTCCMVPLHEDFSYDVDALIDQFNEHTKLVFIANPNNPTGNMLPHKDAERILDALPERAILVLDEAYYEYIERSDYPNGLKWVLEGRNVILLRTFSKIYGLAGLRLGYAIARPELISLIERIRLPFNVGSIAQVAAIASLQDQDQVIKSRMMNSDGKNYFYSQFDRLGLKYVPSEANFVWVDVGQDSKQVFVELLKRGVIIRTGDVFGWPTHIRISTGLPQDNERCIKALEEVLGSISSKG
ncbi:MAG TPA: histidinol-phosphate transaminase [Armatimonadota bacterium]|nr:histidinol-phosphate transaminase [Armatimonadota bacterium]HPP73871.1 histidinol-phosphate transaminase [Armatimonadota bacterium]